MAGSAGFLSMEVKLDLDRAEAGIRDLAKFAKAELGKPIKIDDASFKQMAATLGALEGTYADTLAIVTRMNASTANLAKSTRAVADAAKYANEQQAQSIKLVQEQERTRRADLALQVEQTRQAGELAKAEATASGKLAYLDKQAQLVESTNAAKKESLSIEEQHRAVMLETTAVQQAASREMTTARRTAALASQTLKDADKDVTAQLKEQAKVLEEIQDVRKASAALSGLKAAGAGTDWMVTAAGAAQAQNYGYAVGALAQAGKAAATALRGLGPAGMAAAAGVAAVTVAAVGAAAAVGALTVKVAQMGTREAIGMETLVTQLNAMMPSAEMARKEIEGIFQLGTTTIAPTATLIELDRRLLMAGGSAAYMRQQVLEGFGAFSTAAGLTTEQMNSLNYLIGEVTLKGRLMRTEMSQQFSSAGLSSAGFLEATAQATG